MATCRLALVTPRGWLWPEKFRLPRFDSYEKTASRGGWGESSDVFVRAQSGRSRTLLTKDSGDLRYGIGDRITCDITGVSRLALPAEEGSG